MRKIVKSARVMSGAMISLGAAGMLAACTVNAGEPPKTPDTKVEVSPPVTATAPDTAGTAAHGLPAGAVTGAPIAADARSAAANPAVPPLPPIVVNASSAADGSSCSGASECESGVCEGEGCAPGEGKCVSAQRMCTRDLRPYCGCGGATFQSSGSCAGRRYSKRGPCD